MEKENAEIVGKLNQIITGHGVRVDAFIPLLNKIDKINENLIKIQKSLYFIEDRQKEMLSIKKNEKK